MIDIRKNCKYRHDNGNCLKVGGFCLAVSDEHCERALAIKALQEPEIVYCKDCVYWKAARIGICGLAGYFIGERGYCLYGKAGEQE